jgi:hypothetical protein
MATAGLSGPRNTLDMRERRGIEPLYSVVE